MIESGSARLGITVAETLRRKRKITITTSTKASSIVNFTSFTDSRIDSERSNRTRSLTDGGISFPRTGRSAFTSSATCDRVRARLALDREDDRALGRLVVEVPRRRLVVLDAVDHAPELLEAHGGAVAVRDDDRVVGLGVRQLARRLDGERALLPVERAGREVHVRVPDRLGHLVDADAAAGERVRVDLDAHGVLLRAEDLHLRDAAHHRDALREQDLGVLVEGPERQRRRGEADVEDRLVGRVHLPVRRRRRHVGRQEAAPPG